MAGEWGRLQCRQCLAAFLICAAISMCATKKKKIFNNVFQCVLRVHRQRGREGADVGRGEAWHWHSLCTHNV